MPKSAQQARMRDIRTLDFHIFIPSLHSSAKLSTSKVLWQVKRQQRRMTRSRVPVSEPDFARLFTLVCLGLGCQWTPFPSFFPIQCLQITSVRLILGYGLVRHRRQTKEEMNELNASCRILEACWAAPST